jgi:hypothetical protein
MSDHNDQKPPPGRAIKGEYKFLDLDEDEMARLEGTKIVATIKKPMVEADKLRNFNLSTGRPVDLLSYQNEFDGHKVVRIPMPLRQRQLNDFRWKIYNGVSTFDIEKEIDDQARQRALFDQGTVLDGVDGAVMADRYPTGAQPPQQSVVMRQSYSPDPRRGNVNKQAEDRIFGQDYARDVYEDLPLHPAYGTDPRVLRYLELKAKNRELGAAIVKLYDGFTQKYPVWEEDEISPPETTITKALQNWQMRQFHDVILPPKSAKKKGKKKKKVKKKEPSRQSIDDPTDSAVFPPVNVKSIAYAPSPR